MEREPEHPAADVAAERADPRPRRDRARASLTRRVRRAVDRAPSPAGPAARVTSERPALERVTMERAALLPHPRWRRFRDAITQPRWLARSPSAPSCSRVGGIFGSQLAARDGRRGGRREAPRSTRRDVSVAVLNGTDRRRASAARSATTWRPTASTSARSPPSPSRSTRPSSCYEPGSRGRPPSAVVDATSGAVPVQPIDRQAQRLADGADVVVIAGQDRAGAARAARQLMTDAGRSRADGPLRGPVRGGAG